MHAHVVRSGHRRDIRARNVGFGQDQVLRRLRPGAPRSRRACFQRIQNMKRSLPRHVLRLMMITPVESPDIPIIVVQDLLRYTGAVGRLRASRSRRALFVAP